MKERVRRYYMKKDVAPDYYQERVLGFIDKYPACHQNSFRVSRMFSTGKALNFSMNLTLLPILPGTSLTS